MIKSFLERESTRFLVVGVVGFLVNASILYLLHGIIKLPLILAQIISAESAIVVSFLLHNTWTYKQASEKPLHKRFGLFNVSAWTGNGINTIVLLGLAYGLYINYLVALMLGSLTAMTWSYAANRQLIWQKQVVS